MLHGVVLPNPRAPHSVTRQAAPTFFERRRHRISLLLLLLFLPPPSFVLVNPLFGSRLVDL